MGRVLDGIKSSHPKRIGMEHIGVSLIIEYIGILRTIWDFIIYHPIIRSNQKLLPKDEFILNIFRIVRSNSSMLSQKEHNVVMSPSRRLIPSSIDMIRGGSRIYSGREQEELEEQNYERPLHAELNDIDILYEDEPDEPT